MRDQRSGYCQKELNYFETICFNKNIYVPLTLRRHVIYWYHFYIKHPYGSRLTNTIRKVCYWKSLVLQAEISIKTCNKCQPFKKIKTLFGQLQPKIIAVLKPQNLVHIDLICPYSRSIRKYQPVSVIIKKDVSLILMKMIDTATGWFEIFDSLDLTSMR